MRMSALYHPISNAAHGIIVNCRGSVNRNILNTLILIQTMIFADADSLPCVNIASLHDRSALSCSPGFMFTELNPTFFS